MWPPECGTRRVACLVLLEQNMQGRGRLDYGDLFIRGDTEKALSQVGQSRIGTLGKTPGVAVWEAGRRGCRPGGALGNSLCPDGCCRVGIGAPPDGVPVRISASACPPQTLVQLVSRSTVQCKCNANRK